MDKEKVMVELVSGCEGRSVYINDYRVAGPKPWGGGSILKQWITEKSDILKALGEHPEQKKNGKWIKDFDHHDIYKCSLCDGAPCYQSNIKEEYKFCPYCGALMSDE